MAGIVLALGVALAAIPGSRATARASEPGIVFPASHWEERAPSALGLDGGKLDQLATLLGGRGCVIKNGYVVKAWGAQSQRGNWASSSKPVLSTLLFFAIAEGKLPGVDARIADQGVAAGGEGSDDDVRPPGEHDQRLCPARAAG
jgi:hypothetical protein